MSLFFEKRRDKKTLLTQIPPGVVLGHILPFYPYPYNYEHGDDDRHGLPGSNFSDQGSDEKCYGVFPETQWNIGKFVLFKSILVGTDLFDEQEEIYVGKDIASKLVSLNITFGLPFSLRPIPDVYLNRILKETEKLEYLKIKNVSDEYSLIIDIYEDNIFENLKLINLKSWQSRNVKVPNELIEMFSAGPLKRLVIYANLDWEHLFTLGIYIRNVDSFKNLETVAFGHHNMLSDLFFTNISVNNVVKHIVLDSVNLTGGGWVRMPNVELMILKNCPETTARIFDYTPNLKYLKVRTCPKILRLPGITSLEYLYIIGPPLYIDDTDRFMKTLKFGKTSELVERPRRRGFAVGPANVWMDKYKKEEEEELRKIETMIEEFDNLI